MEATRLIWIVLNSLGVTAFLGGILLNIGDWKASILFGLGALYGFARLIVYCIKSVQDIRYRNYHLHRKKKAQQNESSSSH
jgi:4-hydroxybenzoate polyprenyltransferase